MRDIITPVSYEGESSSTSSWSSIGNHAVSTSKNISRDEGGDGRNHDEGGDNCEDERGEQDYRNYGNGFDGRVVRGSGSGDGARNLPGSSQTISRTCCERHAQNRSKSPIYRAVRSGIPVYPSAANYSSWHRKLTKTRWQPPTDGRQYERQASTSPISASYSNSPRPLFSAASQRAPSLVRYQPSCSKKRLDQLARLRSQKEPQYRVRRPEKAEQVEKLIEQLERANANWDEDEQLLDRAERRDWPQSYYQKFGSKKESSLEQEQQGSEKNLEFGTRTEADLLELEAIARSHSIFYDLNNRHQMEAMERELQEMKSLDRRHLSRFNRQPAPFPDKQSDDQAFRRLNSRPSRPTSGIDHRASAATQQSYLLCSNAYDQSPRRSSSRASGDVPDYYNQPDTYSVEKRLKEDDLHYRHHLRRKPDPYEPPFGIPRQPAAGGGHSTASHYLRRQQSQGVGNQSHRARSESRVSFAASEPETTIREVNCGSVDSGLVAGRNNSSTNSPLAGNLSSSQSVSPASTPPGQQRINGIMRHRPDSLEPYEYENEIDLVGDFDVNYIEHGDMRCESPALEICRAEMLVRPTRNRAQIDIANPRAKSPLLRTSTRRARQPTMQSGHAKSNGHPEPKPKGKIMVDVQSYEERYLMKREVQEEEEMFESKAML